MVPPCVNPVFNKLLNLSRVSEQTIAFLSDVYLDIHPWNHLPLLVIFSHAFVMNHSLETREMNERFLLLKCVTPCHQSIFLNLKQLKCKTPNQKISPVG